jgi:hypothetical protein
LLVPEHPAPDQPGRVLQRLEAAAREPLDEWSDQLDVLIAH